MPEEIISALMSPAAWVAFFTSLVIFFIFVKGTNDFFDLFFSLWGRVIDYFLSNFFEPRFPEPVVNTVKRGGQLFGLVIALVPLFFTIVVLIGSGFGNSDASQDSIAPDMQQLNNDAFEDLSALAERILVIEETLASTPSEDELIEIIEELGDLRATILNDPERILELQRIDTQITLIEGRLNNLDDRVNFVYSSTMMLIGSVIAAFIAVLVTYVWRRARGQRVDA